MSENEKMLISTFCRKEREYIDAFEKWWNSQNEKDPDKFPSELGPGEWDEQFAIWADEKEQEQETLPHPCLFFNTFCCKNKNCTEEIQRRCASFTKR